MSEVSQSLPASWALRPLSVFIAELESGVSVNSVDRTFVGNEVGVLKTSCASDGKFLPHEHKAVWPKDMKRARVNPRRGEIIISRMNTPNLVGDTGLVKKSEPFLFLPDRLWQTVSAPNRQTDFRWLNQVLQWGPVRKLVRDAATGTSNSMKNIAKSAFLAIQVPTPSFNEQRGIAEVLSALDEQIEAVEASIEKQRTICTGLLQDLFPEGFDVESKPKSVLADALRGIDSGKSFMCSDKPAKQGQWGVLKVSAVRPGGFESIENKSVENLRLVNEQYEVKHGDLLITRANTPALVAAACLVDMPQSKLLLCDKTLRLRPAEGVFPTYLWLWLQTPVVRKHIDAHATGTSAGMKNISQKAIKSIPIHLPDLSTQENRSEPVVTQLDLLREMKAEATKLRLQKQGLMRDLLTGKVRVAEGVQK
jgi:type I restriction enzyme S subunit